MKLALPELAGRSVDLLGTGIDNTALLAHLSSAGPVRAWVDDLTSISSDIASVYAAADVPIGAIASWGEPICPVASVVVRSPGFPRYRPDVAAKLTAATESTVTTAINLWLETYGDSYPTVLVTGTKGKSTVARMLASIIDKSELVGNIGTPIWSIPVPSSGAVIVCEVSSYQAVDMTHRADVGILTSLSEDHISWHGSIERYHADKLAPILASHTAITVNTLQSALSDHPDVRCVKTPAGSDALGTLPAHMARNAMLAVTTARYLAANFDSIKVAADPEATIVELPPLIGRLRELDGNDEHRWFDDSLASNPSGAAAAVTAFSKDHLWLILGGLDRGVSLDPLVEALAAVTGSISIVSVPDNGSDLATQIQSAGISIAAALTAPDVESAVAAIRNEATKPATVLFSPAAPTPPQHGNWSNRSDSFEAAVTRH